jgi:hypothetical protein
MKHFPLETAPESTDADQDWITLVPMGTTSCPHCGQTLHKTRMVLGEVAASCRRCCYWRIEHSGGLIEEGRKPTGLGVAPDRGYHVYRRARTTAALFAA